MVCRFSTAEPIIVPQDIFTQAGCDVTTSCSAEDPHTIGWSTRRTSFTFQNTSTRFSWVSVTYEILMVLCVRLSVSVSICLCACGCMCVCGKELTSLLLVA